MEENEIEPLLVSINSIDVEMFAIQKPENEPVVDFKFGLRIHAVNAGESVLTIKVYVAFPDPANEEQLAASAAVEFGFLIEGIEKLLRDGIYYVPRDLFETLANTAYNTMRGIMISRGAGTFVQTIVLPIIDPARLVDEHTKTEEGVNVEITPSPGGAP